MGTVKPERAGAFDVVVTEGNAREGTVRSAIARLRADEADPELSGDETDGTQFLRSLTRGTGGRMLRPGEVRSYLAGVPKERTERTEAVRADIWRSPWYVLAALGLLMTEWWMRRRGQIE